MRELNSIDFWRGFALVTIFINHIPGNVLGTITYRNLSVSDSAELFVFLAGWSVALVSSKETPGQAVLRFAARAVEVYRMQVFIMLLALAMLAGVAFLTQNQLFLEWHNAELFFFDPARAVIGLALLSYQLGYFNILPLYVVLLLAAPAIVLLGRLSPALLFLVSASVYAATLTWNIDFPSWPQSGVWFLDPLAWQMLFVAGFLLGSASMAGFALDRWARRLFPLALAIVVLGAVVTYYRIYPDPMRVPAPRLFFLFDKTHLSPARLIHVLALAIVFGGLFVYITKWIRSIARLLCALGRNSLAVFAVGSLASLAAQLVHFYFGHSIVVDVAVVSAGIAVMVFAAWFAEWRRRSPRGSPQSSSWPVRGSLPEAQVLKNEPRLLISRAP